MDIVQVWAGPTDPLGRLLQIIFLGSILGALPAALLGSGLATWASRRAFPPATVWAPAFLVALLFQIVGAVSTGIVILLLLSEVEWVNIFAELGGTFGAFVGAASLNLAASVVGIRSWRTLRATVTQRR